MLDIRYAPAISSDCNVRGAIVGSCDEVRVLERIHQDLGIVTVFASVSSHDRRHHVYQTISMSPLVKLNLMLRGIFRFSHDLKALQESS